MKFLDERFERMQTFKNKLFHPQSDNGVVKQSRTENCRKRTSLPRFGKSLQEGWQRRTCGSAEQGSAEQGANKTEIDQVTTKDKENRDFVQNHT